MGGIIFNSLVSRKIALTVLLVCAAFAIPTFNTGEGAEEVVEHMSKMTKQTHHLIHEHEEKAEFFMPFIWAIILLSLSSLFFEWKKKSFAKYVSILTLIVSLIGCYIAREVGTSGGEIAHPEIRKEYKVIEEHED